MLLLLAVDLGLLSLCANLAAAAGSEQVFRDHTTATDPKTDWLVRLYFDRDSTAHAVLARLGGGYFDLVLPWG